MVRRKAAHRRRAGRFADRKARKAQWDAVRPRLFQFGAYVVCVAIVGVLGGLFLGGWFGGFVAGLAVAGAISMPMVILPAVTGTMPQMMGAGAERDSSAAVHKAVRAPGRVFDSLTMLEWEVDHVVLLPGRALALETKWSASPWQMSADRDGRVGLAVHQVTQNAGRLERMLHSAEVGLPVDVDRVVVLWGRLVAGEPRAAEVDGCPVVHGSQLRRWVRDWCDSHDEQASESFLAACRRMDAYLEKRDRFENERDPEPWIVRRGLYERMEVLAEGLIASSSSALVATLAVTRFVDDLALVMPILVALGALGWVVLRRLERPVAGAGWAGGMGAVFVAVLVLVLWVLVGS